MDLRTGRCLRCVRFAHSGRHDRKLFSEGRVSKSQIVL